MMKPLDNQTANLDTNTQNFSVPSQNTDNHAINTSFLDKELETLDFDFDIDSKNLDMSKDLENFNFASEAVELQLDTSKDVVLPTQALPDFTNHSDNSLSATNFETAQTFNDTFDKDTNNADFFLHLAKTPIAVEPETSTSIPDNLSQSTSINNDTDDIPVLDDIALTTATVATGLASAGIATTASTSTPKQKPAKKKGLFDFSFGKAKVKKPANNATGSSTSPAQAKAKKSLFSLFKKADKKTAEKTSLSEKQSKDLLTSSTKKPAKKLSDFFKKADKSSDKQSSVQTQTEAEKAGVEPIITNQASNTKLTDLLTGSKSQKDKPSLTKSSQATTGKKFTDFFTSKKTKPTNQGNPSSSIFAKSSNANAGQNSKKLSFAKNNKMLIPALAVLIVGAVLAFWFLSQESTPEPTPSAPIATAPAPQPTPTSAPAPVPPAPDNASATTVPAEPTPTTPSVAPDNASATNNTIKPEEILTTELPQNDTIAKEEMDKLIEQSKQLAEQEALMEQQLKMMNELSSKKEERIALLEKQIAQLEAQQKQSQ